MNSCAIYSAVFLAVLALLKTGEALQCWECTSDEYGPCSDRYFHNSTNFPRVPPQINYGGVSSNIPHIQNCGNNVPAYGGFGGRQACLKKVVRNTRFGRTTYTRQCHTLLDNERIGYCPSETTNSDVVIDFCEYCDTHECNGATSLQKNAFMGLLFVAIALMLRK